ncbi:hypothetical protein FA13DRAFT_1820057 [Coprinellus micaceus]|uniref:Uncharacterized protein n=1 Tax=Coprinellus micaceus TaxID=71717 RepID=A0A4Y7SFJ9_COPMI|nr:hypothetical protein FA13DRAFT_1820057 [Coprinellus micaceus]
MRPPLFSLLSGSDFEISLLECGMISSYNNSDVPHKNAGHVPRHQRLHRLASPGPARFRLLRRGPQPVADGTLKSKEEEVFEGLQRVGDALLAVQKGANKTKAVIRVAEASGCLDEQSPSPVVPRRDPLPALVAFSPHFSHVHERRCYGEVGEHWFVSCYKYSPPLFPLFFTFVSDFHSSIPITFEPPPHPPTPPPPTPTPFLSCFARVYLTQRSSLEHASPRLFEVRPARGVQHLSFRRDIQGDCAPQRDNDLPRPRAEEG